MSLEKKRFHKSRRVSIKRNETKKKERLLPLFSWTGGKRREIKHFQSLIPCYEKYGEPFVGAGAVYFSERPNKAYLNDYLPDVTNFYKVMKNGDGNELDKRIQSKGKNSEKEFLRMQNAKPTSELGKAEKFLYLRKTVFGGAVTYNKKGEQVGSINKTRIGSNMKTSRLKNKEYANTLRDTKILTGDFERAIRANDSPTTFHFCDPPYDSPTSNYTGKGFRKEEHERLAKVFYSIKGKMMITINDTPFIRSLYQKKDIKKRYGADLKSGALQKGKTGKMKTLVICNYPV